MDILTDTPFKILNQGHCDTIVEYRNIENDLPLYEQKFLESKSIKFKKQQIDFNSAELYNEKLRSMYANIDSYKIKFLPEIYKTKYFKTYKINQIITVTEYLQKVLKMIFSIDNMVSKLEERVEINIREKEFYSIIDKDIFKIKLIIEELLDSLCNVKVSITELQTDKSSVNIKEFVNEIWEILLLSLAVCYVPDEFVSKIDTLFPGITLKKISSLGKDTSNKELVLEHLINLKEHLFFVLNLFITHLSNQFSFYVTSECFLNNPKGLAIFVIPMSMYIMFDFYQSGLTSSESVKKDSKDLYYINSKQMEFFKTVDYYLKNFLEEANIISENIKNDDEIFNIITFLSDYKKLVPNARTKQLESFFADPVIYEKMTVMVQNAKHLMVVSISNNENPWDVVNLVKEEKDIDNSTIYFLLKLFEMRTDESIKFPQAQLRDLLNLCAYSTRPTSGCMNEHVRRYYRGNYHVSKSYYNLFLPILMS